MAPVVLESLLALLPAVDAREALWFTAVTVLLNSLVFAVCAILELVERNDLFKHARIQTKVTN